jgi:hypothetical protein
MRSGRKSNTELTVFGLLIRQADRWRQWRWTPTPKTVIEQVCWQPLLKIGLTALQSISDWITPPESCE